ncbi:hypothetical protein P0082_04485 [Candidatus Haliotispira prima]|uniref:EF-hand domain-containing protein n=1 Tax=Candidatus Haliotispira prima TaxID=3034016 RepID=A0ABY8MLR1_9SPIO|nr:hypothetical protein P0082_04485 [Candidatus Haliotispira prima]
MKKFNLNLLILILVILVIIMQMRSCLEKGTNEAVRVTVAERPASVDVLLIPENADVAANLDLEAVGTLLGQAGDAEELEILLNRQDGINNLDINEDGVVDFISVTEFGTGNERGFSLSTEIAEGEEQELATIHVQQDEAGEQTVQVQGNQNLYGPNHYYQSRVGVGNVLLFAWLFSPHTPYYSPFAWGYYPPYYGGGYRTISRTQYRSRTDTARRSSQQSNTPRLQKSSKPQFQPKTSSPKASANAAARRSSLGSPTSSQRSFRNSSSTAGNAKTRESSQPKAGANNARRRSSLSNPTSSQRSFQTSVRRSPASRSGSSFGGGK